MAERPVCSPSDSDALNRAEDHLMILSNISRSLRGEWGWLPFATHLQEDAWHYETQLKVCSLHKGTRILGWQTMIRHKIHWETWRMVQILRFFVSELWGGENISLTCQYLWPSSEKWVCYSLNMKLYVSLYISCLGLSVFTTVLCQASQSNTYSS